jgi:hypothetical protein
MRKHTTVILIPRLKTIFVDITITLCFKQRHYHPDLKPEKRRTALALVNCSECGKQISDLADTCPYCGVPLKNRSRPAAAPVPIIASKSRGIAVLLALFLGGLGIHKFYLDRPGWGIVYLLFSWTFIPAIIALFEGIGYIFTTDEKFRERYG